MRKRVALIVFEEGVSPSTFYAVCDAASLFGQVDRVEANSLFINQAEEYINGEEGPTAQGRS